MNLLKEVQEMLNGYYESFSRLDIEDGKAVGKFSEIISRTGRDLKFREKLLQEPVETLQREGFKLPKGFNLKFIEESENTIYVPLLPFVGDNLQTNEKSSLSKLEEIIQMATMDFDFRNQLIRNPDTVLKEKGFEIVPSKNVVILECTDDLFYAILPAVESPKSDEPKSVGMEIKGDTVLLSGRLDLNGVDQVRDTFLTWDGSLNLDLEKLDYISSAGLGLLLMTLKKLKNASCELKLLNLKPAVRNVFVLAGFDQLFKI
jgi:anti-anti-sigma factor